MKTISMKTTTFLSLCLTVAILSLTNCSGNKKEETAETHDHAGHEKATDATSAEQSKEAAEPQFQVDATFQQQLATVFAAYIEIKDALVVSDPGQAKEKATGASEALSKVDMKLLSGAAHNDWMTYLASMQASIKEIQGSDDIEVQRKSFSALSGNLHASIKAFGLGGKEAFYEYCPMAFNNEGAYWLSQEDKIRNPYFGDKMLTCGHVTEKLK
jgi:hypothetical protein